MGLKATLQSLDGVDEALHSFYEEKDGTFVLSVDGIKEHPKVTALSSAFEKEKERRESLQETVKAFGDVTPEDVEALREELAEAREGGEVDIEAKVEEVKEKVAAKYEKELEKERGAKERFRSDLHQTKVEGALMEAIQEVGFKKENIPAVRALLRERGPTMVEENGNMVGVFEESPDGIPGSVAISDYVSQWAETEEAKPHLPSTGKGGSGADPSGSGGGGSPGGKSQVTVKDGIVRADPAKVASGEQVVVSE